MVGIQLIAALILQVDPALTDKTVARYRELIRPSDKEEAWSNNPWLPTYWGALVEANRKDRPILMWAMNGHPLACT